MDRCDLGTAEEVFVAMTTKGIMPSTDVMDSFVEGYCREGSLKIPIGLSMMQSCFNQYGCRPTITIFAKLIESCLTPQGPDATVDIWEAQRGFVIAEQLWTKEEVEVLEPLRKRLREEEKTRGL